jgi:hypothetical protein
MSLTPTQKEAARFLIRRYCEQAENNRVNIHYAQFRPMNHLGKAPTSSFTCDCSSFTTSAFYWANRHTKFKVNDPNGMNYNGYGYTGTLLAHNRKGRVPLDHKFFIGDMALYGPSLSNTTHVVVCRKNGDRRTALWTSHGSEGGPYQVYLDYRRDLLIVVRSLDLR